MRPDMNWTAHYLRLGGWFGQRRRYAYSKSAVRRYVCHLEALQQQRRVEVASKLIKINQSIGLVTHLEKFQLVLNHLIRFKLYRERVFGVTKDKTEEPDLVI